MTKQSVLTFFSGHILKVKLIMVIKVRQPDSQLYACTNPRESDVFTNT